ncbi:MAG: hypothetical protein GY882_12180 [Actinomycetia bacterium]|nr:hypothetical protein [Actinomycetes bacterium]
MKNHTIITALIGGVLLLAASCSTFTEEQQQQYEGYEHRQTELGYQSEAAATALAETFPRAAFLLDKARNGVLTQAEVLELTDLFNNGPQRLKDGITLVQGNLAEWWSIEQKKVDLRETAGGGWWEEALAMGLPLLVGLGVPTSGPLAPLLPWLAPFLEKTPLRNREKRATARAAHDAKAAEKV